MSIVSIQNAIRLLCLHPLPGMKNYPILCNKYNILIKDIIHEFYLPMLKKIDFQSKIQESETKAFSKSISIIRPGDFFYISV